MVSFFPSSEPTESLTAEKQELLNSLRKRRRLDPSCLDAAQQAEFFALDKAELARLRSEEYPANTRSSLLQGSSIAVRSTLGAFLL